MPEEAFDVAGFCVGVVDRDRMLDATTARPGDAVVGIESSGLHANGFSLVRALLARHDVDLAEPYQARLVRTLGEAAASEALADEPEHALATVAEVLLTPTRIYARGVLGLREGLVRAGSDLRGIAHVTGGGLPGNLPRMLPSGLGVRVDPALWRMPSVFRLVAALGGLDGPELRATLNAGIGMAVTVPPAAVEATIASLAERGLGAMRIGEVMDAATLGGRRYAEEASA
jgi:phosphoribosylformylglycinamidine cyclo-ligase